jgi:hypothetical protein
MIKNKEKFLLVPWINKITLTSKTISFYIFNDNHFLTFSDDLLWKNIKIWNFAKLFLFFDKIFALEINISKKIP